MDYSRGIQTLKDETKIVTSQWVKLYYELKESTPFILFVFCISNILYIITSVLYKIISFRRK